jgi:hypothetical protein
VSITLKIHCANKPNFLETYSAIIVYNVYREGDADLYISQYLLHPSYNTSEYCLHSATCGTDRVDIPSSFQRPIGVGVYGHGLHPSTIFQLTVVLRDEFDQLKEGFESILDIEPFETTRVGGSGNTGYRIPQVLFILFYFVP